MGRAAAEVEVLRGWAILRGRRYIQTLAMRYVSLFIMIFVAATAADRLGAFSSGLACVWIANGLYIGLVLCTNPRRRNELLVVGSIANYAANRYANQTQSWSLVLTLADMVQVYVTTYPFRRVPAHRINLAQLRGLLKVGIYAMPLGVAAGAAVLGIFALWMKPHADMDFFISFFCSDGVGGAVTIPLYWYYRRKPKLGRIANYRYEVQVAFLLFCTVVTALFWQTRYPFLFLLFPVLIPVIYASGFVGAAWAVLVTTIVGVVSTTYGHGPFMLMQTSQENRILMLQFYLAIVLVTAFPFAALMMERERLVGSLRASETRYRELARLDGLTQLPNRREFDLFLDISRQRSVRQKTPLSLLLIDIDHFKRLNDQHGHTVGDEYLRKMAVAIASAVPRKTDLVARYGGEEFAVVLDSCDEAGAMLVAERIKVSVAAMSRNLVALTRPSVTVSIGVVTMQASLRHSSKVIIDAADQGLYTAKRNGRDRIELGTDLSAEESAVTVPQGSAVGVAAPVAG